MIFWNLSHRAAAKDQTRGTLISRQPKITTLVIRYLALRHRGMEFDISAGNLMINYIDLIELMAQPRELRRQIFIHEWEIRHQFFKIV